MAEVYVITNKNNGKQYVGKTVRDTNTRWKEHCRQYAQDNLTHIPLYRAMKKHGVDSFKIDVLYSGVTDKEASELEKKEIKKRKTFTSIGYNATAGGDGNLYSIVDKKEIDNVIDLHVNHKKSIHMISKELGVGYNTVFNRLKESGVEIESYRQSFAKTPVSMYNNETLLSFDTGGECIEYLQKNNMTSAKAETIHTMILEVLRGSRSSYLGFRFTREIERVEDIRRMEIESYIPPFIKCSLTMYNDVTEINFSTGLECIKYIKDAGITHAKEENIYKGILKSLNGSRKTYLGFKFKKQTTNEELPVQ